MWFKNLSKKETIPQDTTKPLEELIVEPIAVRQPKPTLPTFEEQRLAKVDFKEPKKERIIYGAALRQHLGLPQWFYDSQSKLRGLGIKGEPQVAIARISSPEQIQSTYSRLERIFAYDTPVFVRNVSIALTYRNSYLENYIRELKEVAETLYSKFGHNIPKELDWRKNPKLYGTRSSLEELEERLKGCTDTKTKEDQLRESLSVYAGKRMLVIGARTVNQREGIRKYVPTTTKVSFHSGESESGLIGKEISNFDVIVLTGGLGTHKITQILQSDLGQDYNKKVINIHGQINPERILSIVAKNAYRFN